MRLKTVRSIFMVLKCSGALFGCCFNSDFKWVFLSTIYYTLYCVILHNIIYCIMLYIMLYIMLLYYAIYYFIYYVILCYIYCGIYCGICHSIYYVMIVLYMDILRLVIVGTVPLWCRNTLFAVVRGYVSRVFRMYSWWFWWPSVCQSFMMVSSVYRVHVPCADGWQELMVYCLIRCGGEMAGGSRTGTSLLDRTRHGRPGTVDAYSWSRFFPQRY